MLRGVFGGHKASASTTSLNALDESKNLEDAMQSASYMMDDNIERAEEELSKGNSVYHKHGRAVVIFLRAVLGFEREVMKEAQECIADAESAASAAHARCQKDPGSSSASIYAPGTEYALMLAELRLMSAVTGVLTESVTESLKGFYKLRQAYLTLDAIQQEEQRYLQKHNLNLEDDSTSSTTSSAGASTQNLPKERDAQSTDSAKLTGNDSDDEFVDAEEAHEQKTTEKYLGRLSTDAEVRDDLDRMTIKEDPRAQFAALRRKSSQFQTGPGMEVFGDNVVDGFIHSGSNMCFGIIQIMLSLLPPAFNTLIKIAGFRGDRIRGLALLWQAAKFTNINGAFAGLVLLGYYNGFVGFCDILPIHGTGALPKSRCANLLKSFRLRYPNSRLWILEEARMLSSDRKLTEAIEILDQTPDANLKQVRALQAFEKSLSYMSSHRYEQCADGFQRCVKLNNWSHGLYYFVAAVSWVEIYRELKVKDDAKGAADAKIKATDLLRKTPDHIGRKKMMGRQLPFDAFVGRKIQKWEHRAKEWNIDLVDAVGVAPLEEMIYMWNGYKRMNPEQLEFSLTKLKWSTSTANPTWSKEGNDETCILKLLEAAVYRNLGRREEARELLMEIMLHPWQEFKVGLKDNWTLPVAHYEMAVIYWKDHTEGEGDIDAVREAQNWLEKVAAWEAYDLDARYVITIWEFVWRVLISINSIGMRVKTGLETVRKEIEVLTAS
jgi:hypothetical protein